jgi:hypothetical protein
MHMVSRSSPSVLAVSVLASAMLTGRQQQPVQHTPEQLLQTQSQGRQRDKSHAPNVIMTCGELLLLCLRAVSSWSMWQAQHQYSTTTGPDAIPCFQLPPRSVYGVQVSCLLVSELPLLYQGLSRGSAPPYAAMLCCCAVHSNSNPC